MNSSPKPAVWILGLCLLAGAIYAGYLLGRPAKVRAQDAANTALAAQPADPNQTPTGTNPQPPPSAPMNTRAATPPTNAPPTVAGVPTNNAPPSGATASVPATPVPLMPPPNILPMSPAASDSDNTNEVQLSFQNAQVDLIVQWLAKQTGKSVVKHPRVQCQLTIISSTKLTPREAINLVYRALALEGFNVVETSKSILIVPDGQEPKMTPELINGTAANDIPEGRQRLIRFFELKKVAPAEIRDKVKTVLTDKASIEVNERANQLIITDYTDNIRLASELIQALDVESSSDIVIEFFKLKFADAEEITSLLTQILNAQTASSSSGSRSSSGSSSSRPPSPDGSSPPGIPSPAPSSPPGASASSNAGSGVKIWPDKSANQLIISAPKSRMQEIRDLLATLDVQQSEDITMRVIPLQNVSAEDLVKEIAPLYQRVTSRSPKDKVEVTANTRSNSLIVYSSAENYREVQKLVEALDREDAQERVMRAFPLKNADAEDVAKQLETLNEGSQNQGRFPYYIFSSGGSSSQQNKKPTFVADRRRNAVIVQGPPAQMENIEKLIESLDAPTDDGSLAPKIFRMKYVSAVDIEQVLNELFLQQQQQRNYWDPFMGGYYGSGSGSSRDSTGGKLYGKVRITSEPYSNSLIVTSSSPEGLAAVEEMIKEIDSPSQAGETTMRITLNFARANQLASSLNVLFARGGSPFLRQQGNQPQQAQQPNPQQQNTSIQNRFTLEEEAKEDPYYSWLGGQQESPFGRAGDRNAQRPVSDLIGRVRIVPDRRSNSLLVTANLHFFPQIIKLVKELDEPTPQVLIEAKIIEVASDFRDKLGVRWSPDASTFTGEDLDDSILIKGRGQYSEVFSGSRAADALRTGVLDSSVDLNILIQFLRKNLNAKVLAEPQLNIRENELGKLFVGAQVPTLTGSNITPEGTRNDTFNYRDVGVILEVIPHINNSDEVALKINAESSSIRPGETLFGAFILDTRNFKTDLAVKDGETVVLGGIIQREQSNIDRKVPGLGSIPGLGYLFRKKDKTAREVELMVFLRPRITRTPAEAAQLLREVESKVPLIRAWDEEKPALRPDEDPQPVPPKN